MADETDLEQAASGGALTVATDQADYAPGSTATFTAENVAIGGAVTFDVDHVVAGADGIIGTEDDTLADDLSGTTAWTVVDGGEGDLDGTANGTVVASWDVNQDALNQAFVLSATDESGATATTTFTDGGEKVHITNVADDDIISALEIGSGFEISGTTDKIAAGSTITVTLGTLTLFATVISDGSPNGGTWSLTVTDTQAATLSSGDYVVTATAADVAGDPSDTLSVSVDTSVLLDATAQNDTVTANGAIFTNVTSAVSTGTGVFDSFLVIQDDGVEEGFNTDDTPLPLDDKQPHHTNALLLADIPIVIGDGSNGTTNGVAYREFRIDINQNGAANEPQLISLDQLRIYQQPDGDLDSLTGTPVFDLDSAGDVSVLLNAQWNAGSGKGDYIVLIPDSLFDPGGEPYVYLYSEFGAQGGDYAANSGFEEWGVISAESPSIAIDKVTGDGPDGAIVDGDGVTLAAGAPVVWTYTVTNTGNVALFDVVVTDDQGVTVTRDDALSTGEDDEILDVNDVWVYTATGVAIDTSNLPGGDYNNIGTVTGSYNGLTATDSDSSSYVGEGRAPGQARLVLTKTTTDTHDQDGASLLDAGTILVGHEILWTYTVNNAGDTGVDLENVVVRDDNGTPALGDDFDAVLVSTSDVGNDGILSVGETWTFTATGVAEAGRYTNTAAASADRVDELDPALSNEASSTYFGADPSISVDKKTQDLGDGDDLPGLALDDAGNILVGHTVQWTYAVTATGNVGVSNVTVEDSDLVVAPTYVSGDTDGDEVLDVDDETTADVNEAETWIFLATGVAAAGAYSNTATAEASFTDTAGHVAPVSHEDTSTYFGAAPSIDIEKLVSVDGGATWEDADGMTGPFLTDAGFDPMFKFVVHNTGNVALEDIRLSDSDFDLSGLAGTGLTADGLDIIIADLAADDGLAGGADTIELVITEEWEAGQHTNTATVTADFYDDAGHEATVTDSDDANYYGFELGRDALTQGFWGQHQEAWDGTVAIKKGAADTQNLVNSGVLARTDIFNAGGVDSNGDGIINPGTYGILLGDADGDFKTDAGENTLFVSLAAARQIIMSSDSANDTRQILMKQALAAQLNIYNGVENPEDLVGEAVAWLKGEAPYQYTDGSSGKVDTNQNGILEASEYSTGSKSFSFDANGAKAGTALSSSQGAWQTNVIVGTADGDFDGTADGEDLKDALMYFNQGQLITSADGAYVAWTNDNGITITGVNANETDAFWQTMFDH